MTEGSDAPPWTRFQAERWRAALPPRWLPTPGVLLGLWIVVVVGAITAPAGVENESEWRTFRVMLPTVVAIFALLTWRALAVWRRGRRQQDSIAREVARGSLSRWPGPAGDWIDARPLDTDPLDGRQLEPAVKYGQRTVSVPRMPAASWPGTVQTNL
jgi:hypothetical protein